MLSGSLGIHLWNEAAGSPEGTHALRWALRCLSSAIAVTNGPEHRTFGVFHTACFSSSLTSRAGGSVPCLGHRDRSAGARRWRGCLSGGPKRHRVGTGGGDWEEPVLKRGEQRAARTLLIPAGGPSRPASTWGMATGTQIAGAASPDRPRATEATHVPAVWWLCVNAGLCQPLRRRRALPSPAHLPRRRERRGQPCPQGAGRLAHGVAALARAHGSGGKVR